MHKRVGFNFVLALLAGCGASAGYIAELKDEIDRCEVDVDLPEDLTEDQAECALGCIDGDCAGLEDEVEFGDSYVGDCIKAECKFDLFPDKPEISFGEDDGTLSTSAEELFDKPAGNPNPNTLVGIYEASGSGWESVGFNILENVWRVRNEIRHDGIVMGIECSYSVSGEATDARTYYAFASSPIEVHDWGIRVLESSTDDAPYTAYGFDAHCSVELTAADWPFCLKEAGVPEDYTACVTVRGGELQIVTREGDVQSSVSQGSKIAN